MPALDKKQYWVYDIETFKNVFTMSLIRADGKHERVIEVSSRKNQIDLLIKAIDYFKNNSNYMVGFNNLSFDYPVLHKIYNNADDLIKMRGEKAASVIYKYAQEQIDTARDGFAKTVSEEEVIVKQVDLYKIHHFDNAARSTSLKMLQFNMRSDTVEDLPFEHDAVLTEDQIDKVISYNLHDVHETLKFFNHSITAIEFRLQLSEKYGKDFLNHNDTKIGKDYFIMRLEEEIPGSCYKIQPDGRRKLNQTPRPIIDIRDCLFSYYDFKNPAFIAVLNWFKRQRIKETKGVFSDIEEHRLGEVAQYADLTVKRIRLGNAEPTEKELQEIKEKYPLGWLEFEELKTTEYVLDENGEYIMEYPLDEDGFPDLTRRKRRKRRPKKAYFWCHKIATNLNVVVNGFRFDFGVGGIHGSIESKIAKETKTYDIIDADVSSMYPNIAIANRVYPEHLSEKFCDIYEDVYKQRKNYPKGSAENMMLKLALNGVYGDSNNEYSPFYDPKYTMTITVNGQLSICLLAEKLLTIEGLKIIQVNTDGITVAVPKVYREKYFEVCEQWQKQVGLQLEFADYSKMFIRDVNNYIALYKDGKIKRKGAYQYEGLGWHQNQSALIVPMAAEAHMLHGANIREFLENHLKNPESKWLFMLRGKVSRGSKLILEDDNGNQFQQQRTCRYYIANDGMRLYKIMPPLEGSTDDRKIGLEVGWKVKMCNNINDFDGDVNLDYYENEAEKIVIR